MKKYQSTRIFKNPLLESLTHVHPVMPLIVWVPIIGILLRRSLLTYQFTPSEVGLWAIIGLVTWTFTEYVLHRFVFHFPAKSRACKWLIFLFHGIHHDDPQDPTRLVFPPVPALGIVFLLYCFFSLFIVERYRLIFMSFFLIGYLCYDYIHYATHHFKMTSKIGRYLRAFHLKHHHSPYPEKYGVSNPLWDYIFQTVHPAKKETGK